MAKEHAEQQLFSNTLESITGQEDNTPILSALISSSQRKQLSKLHLEAGLLYIHRELSRVANALQGAAEEGILKRSLINVSRAFLNDESSELYRGQQLLNQAKTHLSAKTPKILSDLFVKLQNVSKAVGADSRFSLTARKAREDWGNSLKKAKSHQAASLPKPDGKLDSKAGRNPEKEKASVTKPQSQPALPDDSEKDKEKESKNEKMPPSKMLLPKEDAAKKDAAKKDRKKAFEEEDEEEDDDEEDEADQQVVVHPHDAAIFKFRDERNNNLKVKVAINILAPLNPKIKPHLSALMERLSQLDKDASLTPKQINIIIMWIKEVPTSQDILAERHRENMRRGKELRDEKLGTPKIEGDEEELYNNESNLEEEPFKSTAAALWEELSKGVLSSSLISRFHNDDTITISQAVLGISELREREDGDADDSHLEGLIVALRTEQIHFQTSSGMDILASRPLDPQEKAIIAAWIKEARDNPPEEAEESPANTAWNEYHPEAQEEEEAAQEEGQFAKEEEKGHNKGAFSPFWTPGQPEGSPAPIPKKGGEGQDAGQDNEQGERPSLFFGNGITG